MAVYTKIEKSEMEEIVSRYGIGTLVEYSGITKGIMNSNYLIKTEKGKYILRILEMERDIEEEKKELKFLEYLGENSIPCPGVLMTEAGEDYIMLKGKMASLFTFLNGKEVLDVNEEIIEKFGKLLGKMHFLSENMKLDRDEKIELEYLYNSISKDENKLKDILAENYAGIMQKLENVKKCDFSKLPFGIIHNDIFPDNVFTENGEITGVIDFNDAMSAPFVHDIAIVLNFWIYNKFGVYSQNLVNSFFKGYRTVRNLKKEEIEMLPLAMDKAALTFVFLRIKKFNFHDGDAEREFKDYRDLLPMVFENKNIEFC
ncbi:MAG: Homoserine kinase [bacterium ADurb.Bin363]|nr:MAG: Homoserine kinase [bacterium ADurb.Bin363]